MAIRVSVWGKKKRKQPKVVVDRKCPMCRAPLAECWGDVEKDEDTDDRFDETQPGGTD